MFPAGQADLGPLPGRVGLAARNPQPEPAGDLGDVLDLERNQLGAAQRAGEAEQQEQAGRAGRARKHRRSPPAGAA